MSGIAKKASMVSPSSTLAIDAKFKNMKAQGIDVVGFGAGEPDFDTPEHIRQAAIEAQNTGNTRYTDVSGIPQLRQAIADHILSTGDASDYLKFLTTGGSDYPLEELKIAGVDLTKPNVVQRALRVFEATLTELEELLGAK